MPSEIQIKSSLDDDDEDDDRFVSADSNVSLLEFHEIGHRVCQVLTPVSLCSLYVILLVKLSESNVTKSDSIISRAWTRLGLVTSTQTKQEVGKAMLGSLYLVLIILVLIITITLVILFVLYMEWHSCLSYYFYLPSLIIMAVISPAYLRVIGGSLSWFSFDLITLAVLAWNFTALGMMAIFGVFAHTPLMIQQLYLIHNSSIIAVLVVNLLPGWAPWMLLAVLVIWDLFAVMAPFGPLNLIINMAERGGIVDMPGLVYSTDVQPESDKDSNSDKSTREVIIERPDPIAAHNRDGVSVDSPSDHGAATGSVPSGARGVDSNPLRDQVKNDAAMKITNQERQSRRKTKTVERRSIEDRGVNIGLGDFIFYGLLIGVTAKGQNPGEYYTTLATFNSILVGLIATLAILALTRRALPALPISIALGLTMAGLSIHLFSSLANSFASEQIFV